MQALEEQHQNACALWAGMVRWLLQGSAYTAVFEKCMNDIGAFLTALTVARGKPGRPDS